MKNTPFSVLACVCLVLCAFLCGLYLGRGADRNSIRTEVLFTEPDSSDSAEQTIAATSGKVNINTADLDTLMTLEGIGETYAQCIIDYRDAHGAFTAIADIVNVPGIGTKRFEAIIDNITVGD